MLGAIGLLFKCVFQYCLRLEEVGRAKPICVNCIFLNKLDLRTGKHLVYVFFFLFENTETNSAVDLLCQVPVVLA